MSKLATIRNCREGDYPRVITLLDAAKMASPDRDSRERMLSARGIDSRLVLEVGGYVIGSIYVGDGNGIGVLQALVVDKEFRGQGYGSRLLEAGENKLRLRG